MHACMKIRSNPTSARRYSRMAQRVSTLVNHPRKVFRKYTNARSLWRYFLKLYKIFLPKPNFIGEMSWDNLIVLDACRFDVFDKFNDIPGKLTRIISAGTHTSEWLQKNFSGRDMGDVVYISANPLGSYYYLHKKIGNIPFYKIVEVWKAGWSEELNTVHPSAVNEATLDSLVSHPQKRRLIHYLQPHHPFIGNVKIIGRGSSRARDEMLRQKFTKTNPHVWDMLRENMVSVDQVWRAYIANLKLVLNYVKRLLPNLAGRTCITSDHGNSFGRFNLFYGHPPGTYLPELLEVPWLEVQVVKE